MKNYLIILFSFFSFCLFGQNKSVQTFTYESTTRDTMIQFPDGDHNQYEKIIMHYSMRCKDALVSTGSERNKGCGEWDYSCNTYIVDSTRVDSVKASTPEFAMPGYAGDVFSYTDMPTYTYYQSVYKIINYTDVFREDDYQFSDQSEELDLSNWKEGTGVHVYYMIGADWFEENEVDKITGLRFPTDNDLDFKNLIIRIAETDSSSVATARSAQDIEWMKVHHYNTSISSDDDVIGFFEDYRWDDASNLLISMSFDELSGGAFSSMGQSHDPESVHISVNDNSRYMTMGTSGYLEVNEAMPEISDEITVSFWIRGADNLPTNTTILEAVDAQQRRQINIHMPWGNGQVYWDCGNDGGGYDRINKSADPSSYKGTWSHWAFTKNANTGQMKIYLNGELWHSGADRVKSIDAQAMKIGSNFPNSLSYYGDVDELRIWNKELDQNTISSYMYRNVDSNHPDYSSLVSYYDFNHELTDDVVVDKSPYQRDATMNGLLASREWRTDELFIDAIGSTQLPHHFVVDGVYLKTVTDSIVLDSVQNLPQRIDHYALNGTDRELVWTDYYYASGDFPVIDEEGNEIATVSFPETGSFERGELIYYTKHPMAYEIMSFVTPYGIGIDFGEEGHTWTFDVTDLGPLLKGNKRLYMTRGGQWQEEMDIRFEFVEGVPDRDVLDIQQIWRVDAVPYANILNDWRFEPRQCVYDPNVSTYLIKTAITGHGQEGEFIPRNHSIDVDGFRDTWSVWKECAENPIYPQGGTWVYDRAGWCPGMATDVRHYDVTPYFQFSQTPFVDYHLQTAHGDSRYIVNAQLVQYGAANKDHDISVYDVVHPSSRIEHGRFNPSCHAPVIWIKNHGLQTVNSVIIRYGIEGKTEKIYNWTGSLPFLIKQQIELPYDPHLALAEAGDNFYVEVELNGGDDENLSNNSYSTELSITDHYTEDVVIEWRTNFTPHETSYRVEDENGNLLFAKSGGGLSNNTTYRDTLKDLVGCYKLFISDTDNDGISWWANNDGNGQIRIKEVGGPWKVIATDFGAFVDYNFTAGMISSVDDLHVDNSVFVYPNPSSTDVSFSDLNHWNEDIRMMVTNEIGQTLISGVYSRSELSGRTNSELSNLGSGIYFIQLQDGQKYANLKLIKTD